MNLEQIDKRISELLENRREIDEDIEKLRKQRDSVVFSEKVEYNQRRSPVSRRTPGNVIKKLGAILK